MDTHDENSYSSETEDSSYCNFPLDKEARTLHVGARRGEIANRIITVGSSRRAKRISCLFDNQEKTIVVSSEWGVTNYTGTYRGVPITVIATGMGLAMIDFIVRESTYHVDGKIAMIRLGTSGVLKPEIPAGNLIIASKACLMRQDYNEQSKNTYYVTGGAEPDAELFDLLNRKLRQKFPNEKINVGENLTCETFYSAQGRVDDRFEDNNQHLIALIFEKYPQFITFEMESFKLLHLAKASKGRIRAATCAIGIFNRVTDQFASDTDIRDSEIFAGHAVLETLFDFNLE